MLTALSSTPRPFGRRDAAISAVVVARPRVGKHHVAIAALLCSGVAWASLPERGEIPSQVHQWQALGVDPLSAGGDAGLRMAPTDAVEPIEFAPKRARAVVAHQPDSVAAPPAAGPQRIRGRAGEGLYWSLRAAGASPAVAAAYLAALATEIDVGSALPTDRFDLVLSGGADRQLLYAGLDRTMESDLQLVRWSANGRTQWIDAAHAEQPEPGAEGLAWPTAGRITSYFGYRVHPIFRFRRFHSGVDFGARWGSPIVAAADGQIVRAGWAGGYGRQVQVAHGGGVLTSYSHMSSIAAAPGSYVRAGQVIGYVGSSGLSTAPHLHYEVIRGGVKVNPLGVKFASVRMVDTGLAKAVQARLKALLSVGVKSS